MVKGIWQGVFEDTVIIFVIFIHLAVYYYICSIYNNF